ncbi:hypothetical protein BKA65DRAFT_72644 [Rhexocercosporidium sp. MPI-PUGE-AT-0058]|nr:hypothetical protein BKA65DRAFT_72644 [Rhexocercosporidium sp. MPI-PUGE-AT-0058]
MNGQSSERRQEQQLPECLHTSTLPIAQQAPSTSTSTSTSPEQDLTAEQKIEQEIQQREQLKRRDAELRLLVPEIRRPEPYGWDQDPGLDGYNATQEREETGYGVPYNRMNGTALNTSHQPTWSDFRERRTGYGVPYKQNKTTNRGNETVPYTSHYNGSNGDNNDDNETTPHPARSPSRDVYGTPYSTRPHTPSHESRPSDPLSRPRERESCTSSSSSSAYTIPLNGRRSTPPYTTSTNKLKPPLTLSSTGTSSRSTSSYIAPRHQGIRTPSYSSSYYSNFPAAASKPGSARCSTSARTSAARRRKGS